MYLNDSIHAPHVAVSSSYICTFTPVIPSRPPHISKLTLILYTRRTDSEKSRLWVPRVGCWWVDPVVLVSSD
jgi:hypothetical protein